MVASGLGQMEARIFTWCAVDATRVGPSKKRPGFAGGSQAANGRRARVRSYRSRAARSMSTPGKASAKVRNIPNSIIGWRNVVENGS